MRAYVNGMSQFCIFRQHENRVRHLHKPKHPKLSSRLGTPKCIPSPATFSDSSASWIVAPLFCVANSDIRPKDKGVSLFTLLAQ